MLDIIESKKPEKFHYISIDIAIFFTYFQNFADRFYASVTVSPYWGQKVMCRRPKPIYLLDHAYA